MAKRKRDGNSLSAMQLSHLAGLLRGTTRNVYHECSVVFGIDVGDEIFDRLQNEHQLVRCVDCSTWTHDDEASDKKLDGFMCDECLNDDDSEE